jgi:hypothetical protein
MSHATQLHDRGYLADYMQIMNSSALPGNIYEEVYGQVYARVVSTVKWTLEQAGTCAIFSRFHRRSPLDAKRSFVVESPLPGPFDPQGLVAL